MKKLILSALLMVSLFELNAEYSEPCKAVCKNMKIDFPRLHIKGCNFLCNQAKHQYSDQSSDNLFHSYAMQKFLTKNDHLYAKM